MKPFPCFTNMFLYETNRAGKHVKHENDQRLLNAHSCPVPTARDVTFHSVLKNRTRMRISPCLFYMTSNMYEPILSRYAYQFMSSHMFEICTCRFMTQEVHWAAHEIDPYRPWRRRSARATPAATGGATTTPRTGSAHDRQQIEHAYLSCQSNLV